LASPELPGLQAILLKAVLHRARDRHLAETIGEWLQMGEVIGNVNRDSIKELFRTARNNESTHDKLGLFCFTDQSAPAF
jgi:hypothetical protein